MSYSNQLLKLSTSPEYNKVFRQMLETDNGRFPNRKMSDEYWEYIKSGYKGEPVKRVYYFIDNKDGNT